MKDPRFDTAIDEERGHVRAILQADNDDLLDLMTAADLELHELIPAYMALVADHDVVDATASAPQSVAEAQETLLGACAQAVVTTIEKLVPHLSERKVAKLVKAQAYIFSQKRPSSSEGPSGDYHDAERYVSFLIMDSILHRCSDQSRCLIASLPGRCFEMLSTVAVEDYVRYKAYLRSLGRQEHDEVMQESDYFSALADLETKFVCICPQVARMPGQLAGLLERTVEMYRGNPRAVVETKQQMLHRFGRHPIAPDSILDFVLDYGACLSLVLARRPNWDERFEHLRRRMGEQREIVNLFEYSTRTLLSPDPFGSPSGGGQSVMHSPSASHSLS